MRIDRSFVAGVIAGGAAMLALAATAPTTAPVPLRPVAVTLHWFDTVPGRGAAFANWMAMLHRRQREAVGTLARERTYFEAMPTGCSSLAYRAPVLLLHGTADWRVPASQALDLASRLQALHWPYALRMVEGGAHVWLDQDQGAIDREVLRSFGAHGGAPVEEPQR